MKCSLAESSAKMWRFSTFQRLTPSPFTGSAGGLVAIVYPEDGDGVCPRNLGKPSHLDTSVCPRKFHGSKLIYGIVHANTCSAHHPRHAFVLENKMFLSSGKAFGNESLVIKLLWNFTKFLHYFILLNNISVPVHSLWHFWLLITMRQNTKFYIPYHVHTWLNCTCTGTCSCTSSLIIDKDLQQEVSVTCDCRTTTMDSI